MPVIRGSLPVKPPETNLDHVFRLSPRLPPTSASIFAALFLCNCIADFLQRANRVRTMDDRFAWLLHVERFRQTELHLRSRWHHKLPTRYRDFARTPPHRLAF